MAGQFTAGLSGGQRKLLLFELIKQRTCIEGCSDLLIALDEPFAGVTDDFVPFIVDRLNEMRRAHNVLLVTNDHVKTLTDLADNSITVSALDRSTVQVNELNAIDRKLVMHAVASGVDYDHSMKGDADDFYFFLSTEVINNPNIGGVAGFTVFAMGIFLLSYWNSKEGSEALVLVAIQIIAYFCLNPYLLSLVDWRNFTTEEAEALMHSSVDAYKAMKSGVVLTLLCAIAAIAYGVVQATLNGGGLEGGVYFVSMLFDSASLTLPFICFGLYTSLPLEVVQILASLPFLFMIFFSTTFTPGGGVPGVKALRFLFARFYLWCRVPQVKDSMEGCPNSGNMLTFWTVFTGLLGFILFTIFLLVKKIVDQKKVGVEHVRRAQIEEQEDFKRIQKVIFRNKITNLDSKDPSQIKSDSVQSVSADGGKAETELVVTASASSTGAL